MKTIECEFRLTPSGKTFTDLQGIGWSALRALREAVAEGNLDKCRESGALIEEFAVFQAPRSGTIWISYAGAILAVWHREPRNPRNGWGPPDRMVALAFNDDGNA